ncbi:glycosyltransferase [bacterium C-53]|nr:glycosyltransferase [Lachnospiraceae bacterium]NBI02649.1 glycosyltransferase [Lachnospiraceae bacterium]RKJ11287.1 glycosyltransferase [bacterium C-53]
MMVWQRKGKLLKVSLILTTYNCKRNLIRTLESIDRQDYTDIEIIIKDGGSTDGTLDVIQSFADKHSNVIWMSGADNGIYDAMNQGYAMSSGDVIAFFNDLFIGNDVISKYIQAIENGGENCFGVHSDLVYATDTKVIRYWRMGKGKISSGWMPGHPTLYLRREVYQQYGLYDTSYKCSADFEFMVRILKDNQIELAYIPEVLIRMFYGGTSTGSVGSYGTSIKEAYGALKKNGVRFAWWIIFLRILRTLTQFVHSKIEVSELQ